MTITQIIEALAKVQNSPREDIRTEAIVQVLVEYTQQLAMHVKQLEAEWSHFKKSGEHGGNKLGLAHTCVDRSHLPCAACEQQI